MNWYLEVLKKYLVFEGRARRTEYWMFALFNVLIMFGLVLLEVVLFDGPGILGNLYALGVLLPSIGVTIRRLHDTGRSGWWLLIGLVPIVGPIVILVFAVMDSQPGSNAYGPNPKEGAAAPA